MAVPTITSVTPNLGHTGGQNMVEIAGTNFTLPTINPSSGGRRTPWSPTARVTFGGAECPVVKVFTSSRILVEVPPTPLHPGKLPLGEGSVDVVVQHLAADGSDVAGESATLVGGYTYQRPQLATADHVIRRVTELLVQRLREQVIPEVVLSESVDYDEDTADGANTTHLATLPAISLIGPDVTFPADRQDGTRTATAGAVADEYDVRREASIADLAFDLTGVSDRKIESIALLAATIGFFRKNGSLSLQKDPTDPASDFVDLPIVWETVPTSTNVATASAGGALYSFNGRFVVRDVRVEDLIGFSGDDVVDKVAVVTQDPVILTVPIG